MHDLLMTQWEFGKPIFVAAFLFTLGTQIQLFITGTFMGVESAGVWRAMQNFALPMMQVIAAIGVLAVPVLSSEFGRDNYHALRSKGFRFMIVLAGMAGFYELILLVFPFQIEHILYNGKLAGYTWMIPWVGLTTLLTALEAGFSIMVRSFQKPVYHTIFGLIGAVSGLLFAPWFISLWGLKGAVASQLLVGIFVLGGTILMYLRWLPVQVTKPEGI
jgi:O-antigen/teichoic acid export membrane protein